MSSSTDPFVPQEHRFRVTEKLLKAMIELPPDLLLLQTHTHRVLTYLEIYRQLKSACPLRVHISIESDRDRLPGLPPPASTVHQRLGAAKALRAAGLTVIITVSPLLPIECPEKFFQDIAACADCVVIDHFIEGDGTTDGRRTWRTSLPNQMRKVEPASLELSYRDRMVEIARAFMPGRVGVSIDGFAGRYLSS